jgi:hypothetical protein
MTAMYGEQSDGIGDLLEALSAFQGEIANVERKRTGEFGLYADLGGIWDSVRKPLSAHGLSVLQTVVPYGSDGSLCVATTLGHKSGQWIRQAIPLTPGLSLQALAAEVTYARRIGMSSCLGIAADWDDDGQSAKSNHAQYVSETDRKYTAAAVQKMMEAEDDEAILEIYAKVDAYAKEGKMSEGSVKKLEADFPRPKVKKKKEAANA